MRNKGNFTVVVFPEFYFVSSYIQSKNFALKQDSATFSSLKMLWR